MAPQCSVCNLKFEREQGYFLGAIYINYAATVSMMIVGFFSLEYVAAISLAHQIMLWIGFGIVFPMFFFRYSKSLWQCVDYIINPADDRMTVLRDEPEKRSSFTRFLSPRTPPGELHTFGNLPLHAAPSGQADPNLSGAWVGSEYPAVEVEDLRHSYGPRQALAGVTFSVARREMFALLGPNGGGKTTLFKILSTLMPATSGQVRIFGHDLFRDAGVLRRRFGVVFQHPSLDGKLTVLENLTHHGHLYGLWGAELQRRIHEMLERFGLRDRAHDLVEVLSGGLQRRTELAKGLLHKPELLLLDEPSTGLDPGARRDLMHYLQYLREQEGVTIVLTTHVMEDAERCDRVAILHEGKLVAAGTPEALKRSIGGDIVVIRSANPQELQAKLRERFGCEPALVDGTLRVERERGHEFIRDVVETFPDEVSSATFGKPTLEDVFIHVTCESYR